jgi:ADP-ribose pyrophosphatase
MTQAPETLFEGRHLLLLRRLGWEYVEHRMAPEAVMIVALTPDRRIVLVEEFRPALDAPVVSLPAGLVGDEVPEAPETAARRELREETGYDAPRLEVLARGPGSAGQSSEMITFFLAAGVVPAGPQAAHDRDSIRVHLVRVSELPAWARHRETEGVRIDPKIWAGLYLESVRSE